jgi:hypothetical protein
MIPTSIIRVWFLGLFSWILLGLGIYLSHKWYQRAWSYDFNLHRSYFDPHIGNNHETLLLAVAVGLLFLVLAGGLLVRGILSFFTKTKGSADRDALPKQSREAATVSRLGRPDGDPPGSEELRDLALAGVAFYQLEPRSEKPVVRCHGPNSVYQKALSEILAFLNRR